MPDLDYYITDLQVLVLRARAERHVRLAYFLEMALLEARESAARCAIPAAHRIPA